MPEITDASSYKPRTRIEKETPLGVDNPLLDNLAKCEEYCLSEDGLRPEKVILVQEDRLSIYSDVISKYEEEYVTGVATLNSARFGKRILHSSQVSFYCGSIDNKYAKRLLAEDK